jgi:uncharacterized membrane protein (DUF485 family)
MAPTQLRLGIVLSVIVCVAFFGFLTMGATSPALLAMPVIGAVPLSFLCAAFLIVGAIALTGIYVLRANAVEDAR